MKYELSINIIFLREKKDQKMNKKGKKVILFEVKITLITSKSAP
jgi:hypothetical protein